MSKQGFLTKEGGSVKSWKKRWCVLKQGTLHYAKSQTTTDLGMITLDKAFDIKAIDYKKKKNVFQINTPDRTYYLQADSEKERDSWISALNSIRDQISKNPAPSSAQVTAKKDTITLDDFKTLKVIGKGSFGTVFLVQKKDAANIYAMKVLNKKAIIERQELEHTKAEKNILQKLVHPFLVNLHYAFQTDDKVVFVMDYVNGGELFFHLQRDRKFPEERVRFYIAEIVLGLEYLHANGVLYRDLKPENILLTDEGHICLTDFGISKEGLESDDARTATFCGTPEYLAPEVLECNGYGKAIDWWSLGTLMYEMLNGLPPFYSQDVQTMYTKIMTAKLEIPEGISPEAGLLLQGLLQRDPEKRLADARQIKAHPFFASIDFDKLAAKELTPPFIPPVRGKDDTSLIDEEFTRQDPTFQNEDDGFSGRFEGFGTFVSK
jgi:RAC serine/threonine-protein kinase